MQERKMEGKSKEILLKALASAASRIYRRSRRTSRTRQS